MNSHISGLIKEKVKSFCAKLERGILSNKSLKCNVVFGPVRSRRLGLVLGINNVKRKICSYNCIYCPAGRTSCCSVCTDTCVSPYELFIIVKNKLSEIEKMGKKIDYILFAGSGDPLLDSNLSKEITLLREFDYPIAVFTNSAMLWNERIQESLYYADYVSLKVDTVNEETWLKMNRPHERLRYDMILNGIEQFAKKFRGTLTTETTLIKNFNDDEDEILALGSFLNRIQHKTSYFMTPMYPPQETFAVGPSEETLKNLSAIIQEKVTNSIMLCCPKTEEFFVTDDFENELLGLLKIHPINEEAVLNFANSKDVREKLLSMIENKVIGKLQFDGKKYFTLVN